MAKMSEVKKLTLFLIIYTIVVFLVIYFWRG